MLTVRVLLDIPIFLFFTQKVNTCCFLLLTVALAYAHRCRQYSFNIVTVLRLKIIIFTIFYFCKLDYLHISVKM
jgi:hypothetical protein